MTNSESSLGFKNRFSFSKLENMFTSLHMENLSVWFLNRNLLCLICYFLCSRKYLLLIWYVYSINYTYTSELFHFISFHLLFCFAWSLLRLQTFKSIQTCNYSTNSNFIANKSKSQKEEEARKRKRENASERCDITILIITEFKCIVGIRMSVVSV